jgi:hypothetical protein
LRRKCQGRRIKAGCSKRSVDRPIATNRLLQQNRHISDMADLIDNVWSWVKSRHRFFVIIE